MNGILISFIAVLILIVLGCNLSMSFLIVSLGYVFLTGGNFVNFTATAFEGVNKYALLAVPLFMIGGLLMEKSGIADRLVAWCAYVLRKVKGGLGSVIPLTSMLFGMLTGSATATVTAVGGMLVDKMSRLGWKREYCAALAVAAAPLGYMIPPNMVAIIFSTVTTATVSQLFMCTIIPGVLWGVGYMIYNRIVFKKYYDASLAEADGSLIAEQLVAEEDAKQGTKKPANALENQHLEGFKGFLVVTKKAIPAWIMPIIILGGIYSGLFSPTEAGAVAALYGVLAWALIYRTMKFKNFWSIFGEAGKSQGMAIIMIPFVMIYTGILVKSGAPAALTAFLTATFTKKWILLLVVDFIFLIAGCFFDSSVLTLVLPPILMPTMTAIGVSPVQFGCMVFCAIGIGNMTPPVAQNLYVGSRVSKCDPMKVVPPLMQMMLFIALPILLLVTYVPWMSTWLPSVIAK